MLCNSTMKKMQRKFHVLCTINICFDRKSHTLKKRLRLKVLLHIVLKGQTLCAKLLLSLLLNNSLADKKAN